MARPVRWLPWVLSIITAVVVLAASPATGARSRGGSGVGVESVEQGALSAAPTPGPPAEVCRDLYVLSAQAAALTGSLALVDREERPARAREAAARVRGLAVQAAGVVGANGRSPLVGVLGDLADALERYAGGDPASPAAVREASASNARLRAAYAACANPTSGGE